MKKKLIEIKEVYYKYKSEDEDGLTALKNINIGIEQGEFVAIIGHNGSGKSTLAKLFNGLLVPTEGTVLINDMDTKAEETIWSIRQTVGIVFQNPDNQIVATTVEEDVAFGPENMGIPTVDIRKRVDNALKTVNMLDFKKRSPHMLSGGQKQRIAIAGIIAMLPQCIVLDEATAMLDPLGKKEVMETVLKLNKEQGITIVYITHFMEETIEADRIIVMEEGKIAFQDTPRKVFSKVEYLKEMGLDVPQMTDLAYQLKNEGIIIPEGILSVEEMVKEICRL